MTRTRVRWARLAVLAGGVVATVWLAGGALGGSDPLPARPVYRVQPGDTLWALARRYVGAEGDPRPLIADIRELNDLSSPTLRPGQVLAVP